MIALIAAVELELQPLLRQLHSPRPLMVGRKPATVGSLAGAEVVLIPGGMGKANAAQALTALLEGHPVRGIVNLGVGGAYPGSGLEVGGVALATEEIYGDEGVQAPTGWISTEGIGIPLLETPSARHFNRFPLAAELVADAHRRLVEADFRVVAGPFVTVSCCSGTARRGVQIAARFGAVCESMEGAALAHVAALYGVPFLAVRGISNAVEDRDLSRWRLRDAVEAACAAALVVLPVLRAPAGVGHPTHEPPGAVE
jgi:futalosine hydrolase